MSNSVARLLRLAARYTEHPRALSVRATGGIPGTFGKLDEVWFRQLGIDTVIDVGANEGQFARTMRALLPDAQIFSFEPIPDCFAQLQAKFKRDTKFTGFNFALGPETGEAELEVASGDTGASSLLPFSPIQAKFFPHTVNGKRIKVPVAPLDDVVRALLPGSPSLLLKIDVQGYEHQVLRGGQDVLKKSKLLILEASYQPFYSGQKLFDEVYEMIRGFGFQLRDTFNMMYSPETGEALQGDFIFIKDRASAHS